jgi:hypothetical protein
MALQEGSKIWIIMKSSGKSMICIVELYKSLGKFMHYITHKNIFTKYLFFDKIDIHIILISDYFGSKLETCLYCNKIPRINVEKVKSIYESPKIVPIHNQWVFSFSFILIHKLIPIWFITPTIVYRYTITCF